MDIEIYEGGAIGVQGFGKDGVVGYQDSRALVPAIPMR